MHTHGCYNTLKISVQWMTTFSKFNYIRKIECFYMLSAEQCSIVNEDEAGGLIGTGPFQLYKSNENLFILEGHPLYFRERPF